MRNNVNSNFHAEKDFELGLNEIYKSKSLNCLLRLKNSKTK